MIFSSEREFKKALRDTLMRAAWHELLSTMANCGKIVTFLCLGISIITWVIILKQLFASGSWILVNIPLDFVSGNIHQYSLRLRWIIVKYRRYLMRFYLKRYIIKVWKVKPWSQHWLIAAGAYPGFYSMKRLEVFVLPLDGMLVHRRSLPRNLSGFPNNLPVPVYTPGWREALWE